MLDALIFDFDGLMVDTESVVYECWQEVYREHGVKLWLNEWIACVGTHNAGFDPLGNLEAVLGAPVDRATIRERVTRSGRERAFSQPLLPGVRELLDEMNAQGIPAGVASSSSGAWVAGHLERLGLHDRFRSVRCRDDVERVKPAPDLYLAALRPLGARPERSVALEDSEHGVVAARAAGMKVIAVPNIITAGADFSQAHGVVRSLVELGPDYLAGLLRCARLEASAGSA